MTLRVAGCDPGTSSLDIVILDDGKVADQTRFPPELLRVDPRAPVSWLQQRRPLEFVAAPSGYGLPCREVQKCTAMERKLLSLVRQDEANASGVIGFSAICDAFMQSELPAFFLPGVIHLPTIPTHRKWNRIDLGTADKLAVAALGLELASVPSFALLEMGSAFTSCLVLQDGQIIDGLGGTAGAIGARSAGSWDGELAYILSPLHKKDLFQGGLDTHENAEAFLESSVRIVAGMKAVHSFDRCVLSGALLGSHPDLVHSLKDRLSRVAEVHVLGNLPGAWVKQAAQGAAILADGLAHGRHRALVEKLRLREASGTVLDWITHPRARSVLGDWLGAV